MGLWELLMPIPLAALIPLLVTGATTGIELGTKLAGVGVPSTSKLEAEQKAQAEADAKKQAEQEAASHAQMLRRAAPDAQAQTGGSLTEAPFASLTSSIAGLPGSVDEALRLLSGGASSGTQGLSFSGG